jgi:hypothetical protein
VTYDAESWTLTNKIERHLKAWGRQILKKIHGPAYEIVIVECNVNQKICSTFISTGTVTAIKARTLRMYGKSAVRKLLEGKPGRPTNKGMSR